MIDSDFDDVEAQAEGEAAPEPEKSGGGSRLLLWLVVASLALLFLPLFLVSASIAQDNSEVQTQVAQIAATLTAPPPPDPAVEALNGTLTALRSQLNAVQPLQEALVETHLDWPAALEVIGSYDAAQMALTAMQQEGVRVTLHGWAGNVRTVMTYAQMLRDSGRFPRIGIQSISVSALPTPTPVPGGGAAPGGGTVFEFVIIVFLGAETS